MTTKRPDVYRIILEEILPDFVDRFESKSSDYGDSWRLLGAKGQFSDINRKFWKLYNAIWCDKELIGEQPDECVEDIIGHCLLLLYILRRDPTPERAIFSSPESGVEHSLSPSAAAAGTVDLGRCAATLEAGESVLRCELYREHDSPHLANYATTNQRQWAKE